MKKTINFVPGIIGVVAIVTLLSFLKGCKPAEDAPLKTSGANAAIEMCRSGMELVDSSSVSADDKDAAMTLGFNMIENSWRLQAQYPDIVEPIWQETDSWAREQKISRQYGFLTLYLQMIDDAIRTARSVEEIEKLWLVRTDVEKRISETKQQIKDNLSKQLKILASRIEEKGVKEIFPEEDSVLSDEDDTEISEMYFQAMDVYDSDEQAPSINSERLIEIKPLIEIKQEIDQWFGIEIAKLRDELKDLMQSSYDEEDVDEDKLADKKSKGPYTKLLAKIVGLESLRTSARVSMWLENEMVLMPEPNDVVKNNENRDIQQLIVETIRARNLSYNMWASGLLYEAKLEGALGLSKLGYIDQRNLASVVSALYSMTESDLLAEIRDPVEKSSLVLQLLGMTPLELDKF